MSSVVISGDSSEGAASQVTGGEANPIELEDSSTDDNSNSNSNSENDDDDDHDHDDDDDDDDDTSQVVKKEKKLSDDDSESGDETDNESGDNGSGDGSDQENSETDDDDEMNMGADADGTASASAAVDKDADGDKSETENKSGDSDDDTENGNDDDSDNDDGNNLATKTLSKRKKHLYGNIESMTEIIKSPYEGNECAEVGEDCFEEFQALMVDCSESNKDGSAVNLRMVALVGDKLARDLYNAHHEIGKSGMLYSAGWKEGKIRDSDFGWIPKRQLLLCLHEHRFAKGSPIVLQTITRNLDCTKLVLEAMKLWDLMDAYPNLASNKNEESFPFAGLQRVFCYKCQIFVARAFATLQILNKTEGIQQSLTKKIKACLGIMNEHVRPNQIELARIRKKSKKRKDTQSLCSDDDSEDENDSDDNKDSDDDDSSVDIKIQGESNRSEHTESRRSRVASSSEGSKPTVPKARTRKPASRGGRQSRDHISPSSDEAKSARKRRRKVPKREEREESIFMMFNTMHMQMQRMNQMMSFFQSQLQDHRNQLREEVREKLMKDGYVKR